jgi:heme/copper-type cytochrome/quinol oxidase subunit 2
MERAKIPDTIRHIGGKPRVRKGAFWVVVLVGGGLQYARSNTKHPSTVLIVWTWVYTTGLVVLIAGLIVYSVIAVRERFRRRQHGGGQ